MCGILGVIHFGLEPVDPDLVLEMVDSMTHRGPDARGCVLINSRNCTSIEIVDRSELEEKRSDIEALQPDVALGHRRLSILDIEGGHQPMCNEDRRIWISYNGEIYNYRELRTVLTSLGHRFKTDHSDTEVILHAYEEWGDDCVNHLQGMFAFALVDLNLKRVLLARDRLGIKPLVYSLDEDRLILASEIKGIVADRSVSRSLDVSAINDYLAFQYVPTPKTIFQQIRKLPPSTTLGVTLEGKADESPSVYWDLVFDPDPAPSEADWCNNLLRVLKASVRSHLASDVPLGAFLSGGLDSSAVVALMSSVSDRRVRTFSIGFEEADFSELDYARAVAQRFGTDHTEFVVKPDALEILPRLVWQFDEPFGDFSAVPTFYVSQLARQQVTVCLSGDGGDEAFAGYDRYVSMLRYAHSDIVPPAVQKLVFGTLHSLFPERLSGKGVLERLSLQSKEAYLAMMSIMKLHERRQILAPGLLPAAELDSPTRVFREVFGQLDADFLSRLQYVDTRTYLLDDILTKVDRTSMLNSLECRVPLLDHRVLEFAGRIPSRLKLRRGTQKYVLKRALRSLLPSEVIRRPKMGFGVPVSRWFRGQWNGYVNDILLSPTTEKRGIFRNSYLQFLIKTHNKKTRDFGHRIWSLLFFELWCRRWLD